MMALYDKIRAVWGPIAAEQYRKEHKAALEARCASCPDEVVCWLYNVQKGSRGARIYCTARVDDFDAVVAPFLPMPDAEAEDRKKNATPFAGLKQLWVGE